MGDSVNLAARLEGLSARYGVAIIASGDTRDECPGIAFRELDRVRVSGREQPVAIYEPLGPAEAIDPGLRDRTALHHEALACYRGADWPRAAAAFAKLAEREPDALLYRLFLDRIRELERDPPGVAWDGTFTHREK